MRELYLFICLIACLLFSSCTFSKWESHEDLVGEWESPDRFCKGAKLIFNNDGTCQVIDVPVREERPNSIGDKYYTLAWNGNKKFKEKLPLQEKWNFSGYWAVREDTLYDSSSHPYYRYWILMSPRQEMLVTKHKRDSIINSDNSEDVYYAAIEAWTESFFPPASLHYLYFFAAETGYDYIFLKKEAEDDD